VWVGGGAMAWVGEGKATKAFSVVATLVRIHLISMLDVFELLRSTRRSYLNKRGSPALDAQIKLAF